MAIYITQIEKHRFVCGLFWQSLSRPRELMKEAADLARKIDFDLMVLRRDHTTAQAGFAQSKDGARRMMFSLGAAVSKSLARDGVVFDGRKQRPHNWLGAFKLPDGKWAYFAVRDANFLPNGDFAGTKEEVLERLRGDYGLGGWNAVIGDAELEEYGFHNFNAMRIQDLLPQKRGGQIKAYRWWGLRPITARVSWLWMTVGALLVAVSAGGVMYWQQHQKQKEDEERNRAIEAARQKMFGGAPAPLPHPWASKPEPVRTAQACLDRFTHLTAGGWNLDEYACTSAQVTYSWSRQGSTIDFLLEQMPYAVVEMNGEKATYTELLELGRGRDEALLKQKNLLEPVLSRLQLMNLSPKIAKLPPQRPAPGARQDQPKPDWETFIFALSTDGIPPTEVATILNQPGIRIEKLSYRAGAWNIEGVMYAN